MKPYLISLDKDNIIQPIQNYLINHGPNKYTKYNEDYLIQLIMEYDLKDNLIYFKNYENILDELKENEIIDDSNSNNQFKCENNNSKQYKAIDINQIKNMLNNDNRYDCEYNIWFKAICKHLYIAKHNNLDIINLLHEWSKKSIRYDGVSLDNIIRFCNK